MPIIAPGHPKWSEFIERLGGPEGCNCRESEDGFTWDCDHDYAFTRKILRLMNVPEDDIAMSCAWYEDHGGECDCEIVFNLDWEADQ